MRPRRTSTLPQVPARPIWQHIVSALNKQDAKLNDATQEAHSLIDAIATAHPENTIHVLRSHSSVVACGIVCDLVLRHFGRVLQSEKHALQLADIRKVNRNVQLSKSTVRTAVCLVLRNVACFFPSWGIFSAACTTIISYAYAFVSACMKPNNLSWFASHVTTERGRHCIAQQSQIHMRSFSLSDKVEAQILDLANVIRDADDAVMLRNVGTLCRKIQSNVEQTANDLLLTFDPVKITAEIDTTVLFSRKKRMYEDVRDVSHLPRSFSVDMNTESLPFSLNQLKGAVDSFFANRLHVAGVQSNEGSETLDSCVKLKQINAEFAINFLNGAEKREKMRRREFSSILSPGTNALLDQYVLDPLFYQTINNDCSAVSSCKDSVSAADKTSATTDALHSLLTRIGNPENGFTENAVQYLAPSKVQRAVKVNSVTVMFFCIGINSYSRDDLASEQVFAAFVCVLHIRHRVNNKTVGYGLTGLQTQRSFVARCDTNLSKILDAECDEAVQEVSRLQTSTSILEYVAETCVRVSCAGKPCSLITMTAGVRGALCAVLRANKMRATAACSALDAVTATRLFENFAQQFVFTGGLGSETCALHNALRIFMQKAMKQSNQFCLPKTAVCALKPTFYMYDPSMLCRSQELFDVLEASTLNSMFELSASAVEPLIATSDESSANLDLPGFDSFDADQDDNGHNLTSKSTSDLLFHLGNVV